MVIYELRKILSRRTVSVLLTALLLLYTALFSSFALELKDKTIPADKTQEFLMLYYNDSQSVEKVFEERQKLIDEYLEITNKMTLEEAEAYGPLVLGNVYIDSNGYTDDDLKLILDERIEYCATYKQSIAGVINRSNTNIEEALSSGDSPNSYYCAYEKQIAGQYENVLKRTPAIGFEYVHGWDTLFLSDMMDLFLVISIILLGATVFSLESESGTLGVLRVSKKGRGQTATSKLLALMLLVVLVVLIYVSLTVLIIGLTVGFSSGLNYIQAIEQFLYAPFALTMFEYLFVFAGVKILVLAVLALAASLISKLVTRYLASYIY